MKNTAKNKDFLITSNLISPRIGFYLGMSAVLLLGGCNTLSAMRNFTSNSSENYISGARRVPTLNERSATSTKIPPMATNVSPENKTSEANANAPSTPYDSYDASGNEMTGYTDNISKREETGNFFTNLLRNEENIQKQSTQSVEFTQSTMPKPAIEEPVLHVGRKLLPENPYSPDTSKIVSYFPNEKTDVSPINDEIINDSNVSSPTVETIDSESANENKNNDSSQETLFDRIKSSFTIFDSNTNESQKTEYPTISSVPQTPKEFETIKQEHPQDFNELQAEHEMAQQEKQALDLEVSGTLPTEKVDTLNTEIPVAKSTIEGNKIPLQPPPEKIFSGMHPIPLSELSLEKNTSEESNQPIVLGEKHQSLEAVVNSYSSDPVIEDVVPTIPVPITEKKIEEDKNEIPPQEQKSLASTDEPVVSESKESLFDGLKNILKPLIEESSPEISSSEDIKTPVSETPLEQATQLDEVDIKASSSQSSFESTTDLPESKPVSNTTHLPSPDIIKTMRPSRYEKRRTNTSSAY